MNPSVLINNQPVSGSVTVSPGSEVTVRLSDPTGANQWILQALSTDERNNVAIVQNSISIIDPVNKVATFTFPNSLGSSVLFQSLINNGVDINGIQRPEWSQKFKIVSRLAGLEVLATNETSECGPFGWIKPVNEVIRIAGFLSSSASSGSFFTASGDLTGSATSQLVKKLTGTNNELLIDSSLATIDGYVFLSGSAPFREKRTRVARSGTGMSRTTGSFLFIAPGVPTSFDFHLIFSQDSGQIRDVRATRLVSFTSGTVASLRTHSVASDSDDNTQFVSGTYSFHIGGSHPFYQLNTMIDLSGSMGCSIHALQRS